MQSCSASLVLKYMQVETNINLYLCIFYFWYFSISFCICAHAGGDKHKFIFVYFFLLVFLNLHFVFVYMQVETIIISDFCSLPFGIFVDKNHSISEYIMERFWTTSRRRRTTLWSYQYPRCYYRCFDKNYLKKNSLPKAFYCKSLCQKMSLCQEMSCLGKTARAEAISVIGRMKLQVNFRKTCWGSCYDSCCGSQRDFRCGFCSTITSQCHLMAETGTDQKVSFDKNGFSKFQTPTHNSHTFLLSSLFSIKLELEPNIWSLPF